MIEVAFEIEIEVAPDIEIGIVIEVGIGIGIGLVVEIETVPTITIEDSGISISVNEVVANCVATVLRVHAAAVWPCPRLAEAAVHAQRLCACAPHSLCAALRSSVLSAMKLRFAYHAGCMTVPAPARNGLEPFGMRRLCGGGRLARSSLAPLGPPRLCDGAAIVRSSHRCAPHLQHRSHGR